MVMVTHDYKCSTCKRVAMDQTAHPGDCCGTPMEITYEFWSQLNYMSDCNELTDSKGFRKKFTALEDPTCAIEIGLAEDKGIGTFSEEQRRHYAGKVLHDGDSPQLRKEILRQRQKNLSEQGIASPEAQ